eukprot:scaffold5236_cov13-Prasinocladus_malaysianus.AAC.1
MLSFILVRLYSPLAQGKSTTRTSTGVEYFLTAKVPQYEAYFYEYGYFHITVLVQRTHTDLGLSGGAAL